MLETLHVEPKFKDWMPFVDDRHPFESVCEYFGFDMKNIPHKRAKVVRKELQKPDGGSEGVYFKMYGYRRFRRAVSRSFKSTRSKLEFRNLQYFQKLGIPACVPMARGEYRNEFGVIRNCLLITRELTDAVPLNQFIEELEQSDESSEVKKRLRQEIIESVAKNLKEIHNQKFFHNDMKWRNLLVRREGEHVNTYLIDCPNGYFDKYFGLRSLHGTIKDLATLDHLAWRNCSNEERYHFLSCYSGLALDNPELTALGKKVVSYRKRRLDD